MFTSSYLLYPTCYINNEKLFLKPGNQFGTKELISRLNQMNITIPKSSNKISIIDLYEKALKDDKNKVKIFDKLKKDNELLNLNIKKNRSSLDDINTDINSNKEINVNNRSYNPNHNYMYEQKIKLSKKNYDMNDNKINPFINQNNINEENEDTYNNNNNDEDEEEKNNKNEKLENLDINNTPKYSQYNNSNFNNNYNNTDNRSNISLKSIKSSFSSLFSGLSSFSLINSITLKYKEILYQLCLCFIIIFSAIGLLYLYRLFTEPINNFFTLVFNSLSNVDSLYFIFPLILVIIFILFVVLLYKKYKIKKFCENIIEKIKKQLKNHNYNFNNNINSNVLSEEDIYRKFIQDEGISKKKFKKSYLPEIKKLLSRKKNNKNFKIYEDNGEDGKKIAFIEFIN